MAAKQTEDWCAPGLRLVESGADGMWLRLGKKDSRFCSCHCNPCVTCGGTTLLFGWVLLCMLWLPDSYCVGPKTTEMTATSVGADLLFSDQATFDASTYYVANTDVFVSGPLKCNTTDGTVIVSGGSKECESMQPDGTTMLHYFYTRETVEKRDCYVPVLEFKYWMQWVAYTTTWLYIITQDVWIIFLLYIIVSKYGNMKMGPDHEPPEFSNLEWFSMIFCCGVGTGLFFFSVGEPINHYEPCGKTAFAGPSNDATGESGSVLPCLGKSGWANRFSHLHDNERAQMAMALTFYHWGMHGWVAFAVVGLSLGLLHYRKGLPMTMKTCFYPLIGTRVYGLTGDLIDIMSIVCTTFGVCTSLGMGVQQINAGIHSLNGGKYWLGVPFFGSTNVGDWWDSDTEKWAKSIWDMQPLDWRTNNVFDRDMGASILERSAKVWEQIFLIGLITFISTISICTGLDVGVKWLSIIAFVLGCLMLWIILMLDDTWFLMNLFIQSTGYYFQYLFEMGFYTGAFDQSEHSSPDGRSEYGPQGLKGGSWMNDWTIFYWGWWISWAPFVGVFLARISKGRTVREFLVTCIFLTVTYNFIWMTVWGGAGLRMEMTAEKAGITCSGPNPNAVNNGAKAAGGYYYWPAEDFTKNYCRQEVGVPYVGYGRLSQDPLYFCSTVTRLSCHYFNYPPMMFDVVAQYQGLGYFLSLIIVIALFLYFITSSDSGSLVDTMVSANGIEEPSVPQRVWWSLTEGISATGLMYTSIFDLTDSSGKNIMKALQSASIAAGLPYTILVCLICVSIWKFFKYETFEDHPSEGFQSCCLDIGVTLYTGKENKPSGMSIKGPKIDAARLIRWAKNLFCPAIDFYGALRKIAAAKQKQFGFYEYGIAIPVVVICYYTGFLLVFLEFVLPAGAKDMNDTDSYFVRGIFSSSAGKIVDKHYSDRYGYFRLYTNEWVTGEPLVRATEYFPNREENMAVGDRVGWSNHLAVFGWFGIFMTLGMISVLRANTRALLKIRGSIIEDAVCTFFFWPSVLTQVNEELDKFASGGRSIKDVDNSI